MNALYIREIQLLETVHMMEVEPLARFNLQNGCTFAINQVLLVAVYKQRFKSALRTRSGFNPEAGST